MIDQSAPIPSPSQFDQTLSQIISVAKPQSLVQSNTSSHSPNFWHKLQQMSSGNRQVILQKSNQLLNVFNNTNSKEKLILTLSFEDKVKFASGFIGILKILVRQIQILEREEENKEKITKMIGNALNKIFYTDEPIIVQMFAYMVIQYLNSGDIKIFEESCEKFEAKCAEIGRENREQLIFESFPKIRNKLTRTQAQIFNSIVNFLPICFYQYNKNNEQYLDFMIILVTQKSYHIQRIILTICLMLKRMIYPLDKIHYLLVHLIKSKNKNNLLRQNIYKVIAKTIDFNAYHSNFEKVVDCCMRLFLNDQDCKINLKIMTVIINTAAVSTASGRNLEYIIQFIHSNWKKYIKIVNCKFRTSQNLKLIKYVCAMFLYYYNQYGTNKVQDSDFMELSQPKMTDLVTFEPTLLAVIDKMRQLVRSKKQKISKWSKAQELYGFHSYMSKAINEMNHSHRITEFVISYIQLIDSLQKQSLSDPHRFQNNKQACYSLLGEASFVFLYDYILVARQNADNPYSSNNNHFILDFSCAVQKFNYMIQFENKSQIELETIILFMTALKVLKKSKSNNAKPELKKCIELFFEKQFDLNGFVGQIMSFVSNISANSMYIGSVMFKYVKRNIRKFQYQDAVCAIIAQSAANFNYRIIKSEQYQQMVQNTFNQPFDFFQKLLFYVQCQLLQFVCSFQLDQSQNFTSLQRINVFQQLIGIFLEYRNFIIHAMTGDRHAFYLRFYETAETILAELETFTNGDKKSSHYAKHLEDLTNVMNEITSLIVIYKKCSIIQLFEEAEDRYLREEDYPSCINLFAKSINEIVKNSQKEKESLPYWQDKYDSFCNASIRIAQKINKIAAYLREKNDKTSMIGIDETQVLMFSDAELSSSFTLRQFKIMFNNLNTLIYYCQQLTPWQLQPFIALKTSLALYFQRKNRDYKQLSFLSKLKVTGTLIPLFQNYKDKHEKWIHKQIFNEFVALNKREHEDKTNHLYFFLTVYFAPHRFVNNYFLKITPRENQRYRDLTFLMYLAIQHNCISLYESMFDLMLWTYSQRQNLFKDKNQFVVKSISQQTLMRRRERRKVNRMNPEQFYKLFFSYQKIVDLRHKLPHLMPTFYSRIMSLLVKRNQISRLQIMCRKTLKSILSKFSFKSIMTTIQHSWNQLHFPKIFDSTVNLLSELKIINTEALSKCRNGLFNRSTNKQKYEVDDLKQDLRSIFLSVVDEEHPFRSLLLSFVEAIFFYYGKVYQVESYIIFRRLFHLTDKSQFRIYNSQKIQEYLSGKRELSDSELKNLKQILMKQHDLVNQNDYRLSSQIIYTLGKLHQHHNNNLVSFSQMLRIALLVQDSNYKFKYAYNLELNFLNRTNYLFPKVRVNILHYFHHLESSVPKVGRLIPDQNDNMFQYHFKRLDQPFVFVFPFGQQIVVLISYTGNLQIDYADKEEFMKVYRELQKVMGECQEERKRENSGMDVRTEVWQAIDKKIQGLVKQVSKNKSINFMERIFGKAKINQDGDQNQKSINFTQIPQEMQQPNNQNYNSPNKVAEIVEVKYQNTYFWQTFPTGPIDDGESSGNTLKNRDMQLFGSTHVMLLLDHSLVNFPFQSLCSNPEKNDGVYRVPSIQYTADHMDHNDKPFNLTSLQFIINPDGTLDKTSNYFQPLFRCLGTKWIGCFGRKPIKSFFQTRKQSQILLYIGKGSGEYAEQHRLLLEKRGDILALLFGNSSARMVRSEDQEPHGIALAFLQGGSRMVAGYLWDLSEDDINRNVMTFLENMDVEEGFMFGEMANKIRMKSRLKYAHGAGYVVYGWPRLIKQIKPQNLGPRIIPNDF